MESLTTGQLADEVGVNVETIRFYERRGLLEEPPRRPSGYRQYSTDAVRRLRFIRRAKDLGFTLAEIQEFLELDQTVDSPCEKVQSQIAAKVADLQQRIDSLRQLKRGLAAFGDSCRRSSSQDRCPFLASLQGDWQGNEGEVGS